MVFGKPPVAGRAKTRLAPALGAEGAARLYQAFLDDVVATARSVPEVEVELWVPGDSRADGLTDRYPGVPLRRQSGADLGLRLADALATAFDEGAERAVVVGSDHPTLPARLLATAFSELAGADAAFGPTTDGGYWATGLRSDAWPAARGLFEGIPWSTPGVMAATRRRAGELGLRLAELPTWYDVDLPAELERIREDLAPGSATARTLRRLEPEDR